MCVVHWSAAPARLSQSSTALEQMQPMRRSGNLIVLFDPPFCAHRRVLCADFGDDTLCVGEAELHELRRGQVVRPRVEQLHHLSETTREQ